MYFAECPILGRKVDGDFTKTPQGGTTQLSCQFHTRGCDGKINTWLKQMVDTEVKEDAEQIAFSLAILQYGPIDLISSNNPLDCHGLQCRGGCYNPSDSCRCPQTNSGCLIPRHTISRLFLKKHTFADESCLFQAMLMESRWHETLYRLVLLRSCIKLIGQIVSNFVWNIVLLCTV